MKTKFLFLILVLFTSCGKLDQVQESITGMISSNDLKLNDVRVGFLYRGTGAANDYDYLEFENTQYRIGNVASDATTAYNQVTAGVRTSVYFKGNFAKRSGISNGNPSQVFDVIDLTGVAIK